MMANSSILLVDDDPAILQSLTRLFRKQHWDLKTVDNGRDAIAAISETEYAIIISDVCMPTTSGIEVLSHALKCSPNSSRILLSGLSTLNDAVEAINTCKADHFILKPCDGEVLIETILKHLKKFNLEIENKKLQEQITSQNDKLKSLNKKLIDTLDDKHKKMITSWTIQSKLLIDTPPPGLKNIDICCYTIPAQELNGDFILFNRFNEHVFDLVVGDVMGKGIAAALQGAAVRSAFQYEWGKHAHGIPGTPDDILSEVAKKTVSEISNINSFISMFYCRLDTQNLKISYIDCGSTKPLLASNNKNTQFLCGEDLPFGIVEHHGPFTCIEKDLNRDDCLILYSDGIIEARSADESQMYDTDRLDNIASAHIQKSSSEIGQAIQRSVRKFTGKSGHLDDFTTVIIKMTETHDQIDSETPEKIPELELYSGIQDEKMTQLLETQYAQYTTEIHQLILQLLRIVEKHSYDAETDLPIWLSIIQSHDELSINFSDYGQSNDQQMSAAQEIANSFDYDAQIVMHTDVLARNAMSLSFPYKD